MLAWAPGVRARGGGPRDSGRVGTQCRTPGTPAADRLWAEPMGLPRGLVTHARADSAPTGFAGVFGGRSGWWKLTAAQAVAEAEPDRRIIWVDDDLAMQAADTGDWLAANPHVLVVAPDLFVGLTHEQLDAIEAWL